jgi:hypothetical protein
VLYYSLLIPASSRITSLSFRIRNTWFEPYDGCLSIFQKTESLKYLRIDMDKRDDDFLFAHYESADPWRYSFLSSLEELVLVGTERTDIMPLIVECASHLKSLVLCGKVDITEQPVHLFALKKLDIAHLHSRIAGKTLNYMVLYSELEALNVHAESLKAVSLASALKRVAISLYDRQVKDTPKDRLRTMMQHTKDFLLATSSLESIKLVCNLHFHHLPRGDRHHWSSKENLDPFMGLFDIFNFAKQNGTLPHLKQIEIEAECTLYKTMDYEDRCNDLFAPYTFMDMVESRGYGAEEVSSGLTKRLERFIWRSNIPLVLIAEDQRRLDKARNNGFSFDIEIVTSEELKSRRLGKHYLV